MPLAPDVFLQANVAAPARSSAVTNSFKPAETSKADASSFSDVYAQQSREKPVAERDVPMKPASDKSAPDKDKVSAVKDKPAAVGKDKPDSAGQAPSESGQVAESGNFLPVQAKSEGAGADEKQDVDSAAAAEAEQLVALSTAIQLPAVEVPVDAPVSAEAEAEAEVVVVTDSVEQSQLAALSAVPAIVQAPVTPEASSEIVAPSITAASVTPSAAAASVAAMSAANPLAAAPVASPLTAGDEAFDPEADPLDGLHALQFALESAGGKSRPSTQPTVRQDQQAQTSANPDADDVRAQNVVNNLAMPVEDLASGDESTESSDRSFTAVLGDGLKDLKSAAGDTRVDNFAERLAALSQAAQPARPVTAPVASPLAQPLSMHQSGWTEGIVDRVMYLSSQNLKSADIKLEPAELGRLDIRINMAPDQQTQVTFASAHLGVRDALESQIVRLRESFAQQGLGQVDVNVSDQSQQQAQQQAQEQANRAQRGGRGGVTEGDAEDEAAPAAAVAVSQPAQRVVGSSEIDFYA